MLKGDEGSLDYAVLFLKDVVSEDPRLEGALTLLGTAYYRLGRYQEAFKILQRALAVNRNDEIAWLVLGLAQLRLGQDEKGINSLKGAITLLNKASTSGYRGFPNWDSKGLVRSAMRRAAFRLVRVPGIKEDIIESCELLLGRVDEEELAQQGESPPKGPTDKPSS